MSESTLGQHRERWLTGGFPLDMALDAQAAAS